MMRYQRFTALALGLFIGAAALLAGCDAVDSGSDTGTMRVVLTDAPGDFTSAVVTIENIYLQADEGEEGSRIVLRDEPVTVDLLTLQNDVLDLVDDEVVPEGVYSQLRLVISGGYLAVEQDDGSTAVYASSDAYAAAQGVTMTGALQMPSLAQSGLKITLPADLARVEGDQNVVLLDFDVAESFGHQAGQSGKWVMNPVIHAADLTLTGSAEVALTLGDDLELPVDTLTLSNFAATLDKGGDVLQVPFEDVDGDGTFTAEFKYLEPGTYPVALAIPDVLTVTADVALPLDVTIESGQQTETTLTLTGATLVE